MDSNSHRLQDVSKPEADSRRQARTPGDSPAPPKLPSRFAFLTKGVTRRQVSSLRFGSFDSRAPHLDLWHATKASTSAGAIRMALETRTWSNVPSATTL